MISLDTFYADVVKFGFDEGIDVVNDISGGDFDDNLLKTVAKTKLPYILMHSNSTYQNMHEKIQYEDIIVSLNYSFSKKINELQKLGIYDVILDPGFGFGKTIEDQYKMIDEIEHIGFEKFPLLIGISRKSFIYKPFGKLPTEINEETQNLHWKVLEKGAKILRVHDVAETRNLVGNARCSENLVEWNRKYNARAISGDVSRVFYYHVISFQEWGQCGQPYMKEIFSELQKSWLIFSRRHVSEAAAETKEAELIGLLFAAIRAGEQGSELVNRYIRQTTSKLMNLEPERQYFNCTYFGDQPACTD